MTTFPETHRDLLESDVAILATIGQDGYPQVTALWFLFDEDDTVKLSLNTARQKVKNLRKHPECTFLDSSWYLVIEIPQGQQAYMAKDHRFYKRVGNTVRPMEQYEVSDVMNRTRAAALELRIGIRSQSRRPNLPDGWVDLSLNVEITSTNFIASEYGALKLTAAYPIKLINYSTEMIFRSSQFESSTGLILNGEDDTPHAQSMMVRWGAHAGNVIFPGDWYNFYGNPVSIIVPNLSLLPNPTYLLQAELFTINSQSKKALFAIRQQPSIENFEIFAVDASNYSSTVVSFWETYHTAREKFQK